MLSMENSQNLWFSHINKNVIQANAKRPPEEREPVVRFQKGRHGTPTYATRIRLRGESELIYDAENALLPCGAKLVIASTEEPEVLA